MWHTKHKFRLSADMLSHIDKLVSGTPAKPKVAKTPAPTKAQPATAKPVATKLNKELTPAALAWQRYLNNK